MSVKSSFMHTVVTLAFIIGAVTLRECKMTAKIAGNNSIEMQSQRSLHWLNMPEQS